MKYSNDFRRIKSIHIKVWIYFLGLTFVILFLMWFLQIFFVNNYYEKMKIITTQELTDEILKSHKQGDLYNLKLNIERATVQDDIFIRIEKDGTSVLANSKELAGYKGELDTLRSTLMNGKKHSVTMILTSKKSQRRAWGYGGFLDKKRDTIIFVLTPLYPVTSTVNILQSQFVYVSMIALLLAFVLSYFLSSRIARPISSITKKARLLANGEYGVKFPNEKSYAEITDLANTLNKTSMELEKSIKLQKDLMSNVSHDLRTPLTMVKSYAEMIRDISGDNPVKRNEHLQVIISEADRLNSLVGDLLTLSAVQAGTLKLNIAPFNIRNAFEQIVSSYKILEEEEGYKIVVNCRNDVSVFGDEERIKQVIANLVSNSIKYCGEDKEVYINIKWWGRKAHCEIVDHGEGIKPEELPSVWDRYYKSSTNHVRPTKGSGIGLSIVKEILVAHKARFGVESKVGRGTTFWFELEVYNEKSTEIKKDGI